MAAAEPPDPRIPAIVAALQPHAWERLSAELLARLVVGALDGAFLRSELAGIADLGDPTPIEPAAADDERVGVIVQALRGCHLRVLTLHAVAAQALRALAVWADQRRRLEIELGRMLDQGQ